MLSNTYWTFESSYSALVHLFICQLTSRIIYQRCIKTWKKLEPESILSADLPFTCGTQLLSFNANFKTWAVSFGRTLRATRATLEPIYWGPNILDRIFITTLRLKENQLGFITRPWKLPCFPPTSLRIQQIWKILELKESSAMLGLSAVRHKILLRKGFYHLSYQVTGHFWEWSGLLKSF